MIIEFVALLGLIMAVWSYLGTKRPRKYILGHKQSEDGPYHIIRAGMEMIKEGVNIYSYPILNMFGLLKADIHLITDPKLIREVLGKSDAVGGHLDMKGWFELLDEYRVYTQRGGRWHTCNGDHIGILRDHKKSDPVGTKIGKLCRRRVMEIMSKSSVRPKWIEAIERELPMMVKRMTNLGKQGEKAFWPFMDVLMPATMSVLLGVSFDMDLSNRPEWTDKLCDLSFKSLQSLAGLEPKKLFFTMIPSWARRMIPLRYWPEFCDELNELIDEVIILLDEHNKHWEVGDESISLISVLETDNHNGLIKEWDVIHTLHTLVLAGGDTTSMSLLSIMWMLGAHQDKQETLFKILEAREFRAESLADVPYLHAFMYETFRICPPVHRSLLHSITEKTEIAGYTFQKDDFVAYALTSVNMSEKFVEDPFKFKEERFLDENGRFKKVENIIPPYITGKRDCPGQILANLQVFHFTIGLLKHFRFEAPKEFPIEESEEAWHATWSREPHSTPHGHFLQPKENRIICIPRTLNN